MFNYPKSLKQTWQILFLLLVPLENLKASYLRIYKILKYLIIGPTYIGLNENDRYLIVNPFFHTFGYKAGWLAAVMRGATAYPCPIFDADKIIQTINKEKISMLPGPPTLYQSILTSQLIKPWIFLH